MKSIAIIVALLLSAAGIGSIRTEKPNHTFALPAKGVSTDPAPDKLDREQVPTLIDKLIHEEQIKQKKKEFDRQLTILVVKVRWAQYREDMAIRYATAYYEALRATAARAAAARYSPPPSPAPVSRTPATGSSSACGGDLPPCWIMMRESGGNPIAQNPSSSASGKWQILDSTWAGYGGYAHAKDAPASVQDAKARSMGICNWQPPNYCAG